MRASEKALKGLITKEEFDTLTSDQQDLYNSNSVRWELRRQEEKKKLAELSDVIDSFKALTPHMTEMPDIAKMKSFAEALIANKMTKWHITIATAEIIRTKEKMTAPCEYFHAITRIKARLRESNTNIFHDKALDF